jgi:hypothetical protein
MASSPSALLNVELQALGENLNTWGDNKLNDALSRLEEAIAGHVSIAVEADVTLTSTDYVQNQHRYAMLTFTGSGGFDIICPATSKLYLVRNNASAAVTFTHNAGGDEIAVAAGAIKWVATDGTDFFTAEEEDYLLLTGGTLTGALTLSGAPTSDLHAATKAYADLMIPLAGGTPTGLVNYASDLSGSFVDRSLVDKAYVDGVALGSVSVSFDWDDVTNKPTTISGFGITDAYTQTYIDANFQPLDATLTALAGLTTANGNIIYATGADTFSQVTSTAYGRNLLTSDIVEMSGDVNPAVSGKIYQPDSTTSARTITLPASPSDGDWIIVTDTKDANCGTNACAIARNGKTIKGAASDFNVNVNNGWVELVFDSAADDWKVTRFYA